MMLIGDLLPLYQMHKTLPGEGISTFLWFNDQEKVFSANISRGRSIVRTEGHNYEILHRICVYLGVRISRLVHRLCV